MNKDLIILNLLIGWEIIHLSKTGKKVSMRLREFPGKDSRFIRVTFSKCDLAVFLDLNKGQIEDFKQFNFKNSLFYNVNAESDGIISIHLLKDDEFAGILKIIPGGMAFEFTAK